MDFTDTASLSQSALRVFDYVVLFVLEVRTLTALPSFWFSVTVCYGLYFLFCILETPTVTTGGPLARRIASGMPKLKEVKL
jgi:hypothetical protein